MPWYVVQTNYREENRAVSHLERQKFEVFCPLWRRKVDGKNRIDPLFPGYIFVKFDVRRKKWQSINGTRGCKRVMCMDPERPSKISTEFVEELMRMDGIEVIDEEIERVFTAGDRLQILAGPLAGHIGKCVATAAGRVTILLHLLGGENRVSLKSHAVELA